MHHDDLKTRISAVDEELRELQLSIDTTRTHGLVYYSLLVVILFVGFAIGYATHTLFGVVLTAAGLALVAWRELGHYRERVAAIDSLIDEKRNERKAIDERLRGSDNSG
jgi:hypothetical protein